MRHLLSSAQSLEKPLSLITSLTVTLDVWSVSEHVVKVRYNMLVRQWINFAQDRITTKLVPKNADEVVLA